MFNFEKINKSELQEHSRSIDIATEINKTIKIIEDRKKAFKQAGFEICYLPSNLNVGQVLKVSFDSSVKFIMKISSKNEYSSWGQQQQAFVILKSEMDFRRDKIKGIVDQIIKEQTSNDKQ